MSSRMILLISLIVLAGCGTETASRAIREDSTVSIWTAPLYSPRDHARRAFAEGDKRLLGIWGYAMFVPGLSAQDWELFSQSYGIQLIRGAESCARYADEEKLYEQAEAYALAYNEEMITLIKSADKE